MTETTHTSKDTARTWVMACHLSSLSGFIVPLANIVVPLILWIMKKDQFPFVDEQGKESINFQISMLIYFLIGSLFIFILIGFVILPLLALFDIICVIIASSESYHGKHFRYPFCIRFLK